MLPKHIKSASDLITSRDAVRSGFLQQAVAKGQRAIPFIERAIEFQKALSEVSSIEQLLNLKGFKDELVAAAGFSEKARNNLQGTKFKATLKKVFHEIIENSGEEFRDEIVFRYLLTKGDSLGGTSRNLIGASAGERFIESIIKLIEKKSKLDITKSQKGKIQGIQWSDRYLVFDSKPKIIGNNIDLILLDTSNRPGEAGKELLEEPSLYLACGELKGGIDPAGADEHWKTANSALGRIRSRFSKEQNKPALFFVGAAIENSMAQEIFKELQNGRLTHAANLNNQKQVKDAASWLVRL